MKIKYSSRNKKPIGKSPEWVSGFKMLKYKLDLELNNSFDKEASDGRGGKL